MNKVLAANVKRFHLTIQEYPKQLEDYIGGIKRLQNSFNTPPRNHQPDFPDDHKHIIQELIKEYTGKKGVKGKKPMLKAIAAYWPTEEYVNIFKQGIKSFDKNNKEFRSKKLFKSICKVNKQNPYLSKPALKLLNKCNKQHNLTNEIEEGRPYQGVDKYKCKKGKIIRMTEKFDKIQANILKKVTKGVKREFKQLKKDHKYGLLQEQGAELRRRKKFAKDMKKHGIVVARVGKVLKYGAKGVGKTAKLGLKGTGKALKLGTKAAVGTTKFAYKNPKKALGLGVTGAGGAYLAQDKDFRKNVGAIRQQMNLKKQQKQREKRTKLDMKIRDSQEKVKMERKKQRDLRRDSFESKIKGLGVKDKLLLLGGAGGLVGIGGAAQANKKKMEKSSILSPDELLARVYKHGNTRAKVDKQSKQKTVLPQYMKKHNIKKQEVKKDFTLSSQDRIQDIEDNLKYYFKVSGGHKKKKLSLLNKTLQDIRSLPKKERKTLLKSNPKLKQLLDSTKQRDFPTLKNIKNPKLGKRAKNIRLAQDLGQDLPAFGQRTFNFKTLDEAKSMNLNIIESYTPMTNKEAREKIRKNKSNKRQEKVKRARQGEKVLKGLGETKEHLRQAGEAFKNKDPKVTIKIEDGLDEGKKSKKPKKNKKKMKLWKKAGLAGLGLAGTAGITAVGYNALKKKDKKKDKLKSSVARALYKPTKVKAIDKKANRILRKLKHKEGIVDRDVGFKLRDSHMDKYGKIFGREFKVKKAAKKMKDNIKANSFESFESARTDNISILKPEITEPVESSVDKIESISAGKAVGKLLLTGIIGIAGVLSVFYFTAKAMQGMATQRMNAVADEYAAKIATGAYSKQERKAIKKYNKEFGTKIDPDEATRLFQSASPKKQKKMLAAFKKEFLASYQRKQILQSSTQLAKWDMEDIKFFEDKIKETSRYGI